MIPGDPMIPGVVEDFDKTRRDPVNFADTDF